MRPRTVLELGLAARGFEVTAVGDGRSARDAVDNAHQTSSCSTSGCRTLPASISAATSGCGPGSPIVVVSGDDDDRRIVAAHQARVAGVHVELNAQQFTIIGQLRDRGYSLSIDDFDTGHSSLAYLKELPVTKLKIDQAFIRNLANDRRDQQIVRCIIDLAAALDLERIVEGVEDEASADMLREWGCHDAQGYLLHAACPVDEFIRWTERPIDQLDTSPEPPRRPPRTESRDDGPRDEPRVFECRITATPVRRYSSAAVRSATSSA